MEGKKKKLYCDIVYICIVSFLIGMIIFNQYRKSEENCLDDINFVGRWFTKEVDGKELVVTLNQGAMMSFYVDNTEMIDIYFRDLLQIGTPYFSYSIDNGDMIRQKITERRIVLPNKEKHLITIVIDSMYASEDKWNYEHGVAFEKIDSHGGTIEKDIQKKKKILFIGDSITEGVMSIGLMGTTEDNSATNSYTWHTAQQLGVEPYFLGYGGIGISERGSFTYVSNVLDNFSSTRKAENIPKCDLIVFNIGSNDDKISTEEFITEYQNVILELHDRYPYIDIVCMIPINQRHAEDIVQAVGQYDWCYVVETADWNIESFDGTHPIGNGCSDMADKLVEYIERHNLLDDRS